VLYRRYVEIDNVILLDTSTRSKSYNPTAVTSGHFIQGNEVILSIRILSEGKLTRTTINPGRFDAFYIKLFS